MEVFLCEGSVMHCGRGCVYEIMFFDPPEDSVELRYLCQTPRKLERMDMGVHWSGEAGVRDGLLAAVVRHLLNMRIIPPTPFGGYRAVLVSEEDPKPTDNENIFRGSMRISIWDTRNRTRDLSARWAAQESTPA